MASQPESSAQPAGRLHRNALTTGHITASTLANIAPAMSFFFGFGVIVEGAGVAAPLTILVAMVGILFLANTLSEFSRFTPSAGSFVTFLGKAFGPTVAAAAAVFVIFGYIVAAGSVVNISGGWTEITIQKYLGVDIPWQIITAVVCAIVGYLVAKGVTLSTRWAAVFFYFELFLLLVVAILVLIANGGHVSLAPFNPANLKHGLAGVGLGFPLAIYLFIGWENSATLAEETREPRKNVPRALFTSTLVIGSLYAFLAFATDIGFHNNAAAINASSVPFIDAARAALGGFVFLAYLAGVTSIFSALIGLTNSQARILFNSGREGLLPDFLGRVHRTNHTPWIATWAFLVISLAIVYIFGWSAKPTTFFGEIATMGTIPVVLIYTVTNLALPVYMLRHRRSQLKPVRHVIVPVIGFIVMLFPLWGLVQPGQPAPFNLYPWIALGALVVSIIYGVIVTQRDPTLGERVGAIVADE